MKRLLALLFVSFLVTQKLDTISLTIRVNEIKNEKGVIQFSIYNKDGSIPDMEYKKYFKKGISKITSDSTRFTFENLPAGRYAVNILHDENENGVIDRGIILPKEGFGFSNYTVLGLFNQPNFMKSSFKIKSDTTILVKIIYL